MALQEGFLPARLRVQPRRGEEILVESLPFPSFFSANPGERVVLSVEELLDRLEALRGVEVEAHPLLIFDQFEEWVTLFEGAKETRDRILDVLVKLLLKDPQLPVKILISLREDYLARLEPLFERCPVLPDHYVRLTALRGQQITEVIRGPFEKHPGGYPYPVEISPELTQQLRAQLEERADSEGVPPTEVQIVCRRLFRAGERGKDLDKFFTAENGVQGLLERFLEESLGSLEPELRGPAVALLARMVTSAGTRNVISRDDLISRVELEEGLKRPLLEHALYQLEDETRLVRRELRRDVYFYEIVSEFLVDWIRAQAEAQRLERVERARRKQVRISIGLAVGLLVMAVLAVLAALGFSFWRDSKTQRQLTLSQLLADKAEEGGDVQLRRRLLLALEAEDLARPGGWLVRPGVARIPPNAWVAANAEEALRRVLARCYGLVPGGPGRPVVDATLSRDRRWLAGLGPQGDLYLWEANAGGPDRAPQVLAEFGGPLRGFDVAPDGRRASAVRGDDAVFLWTPGASSPTHPQVLHAGGVALNTVRFAGAGRWLLAMGNDQIPQLWPLAGGNPAGSGQRLACSEGLTMSWQLSPGARRLAVACDDGSVLAWNLEASPPLAAARRLQGHGGEISTLSFDASGTRLATGDLEGTIDLWDLASNPLPPRRTTLAREPEEITALALSPDGRRLIAGGLKGSILSWEPEGASPQVRFRESEERIEGVTWDTYGRGFAIRGAKQKQPSLYSFVAEVVDPQQDRSAPRLMGAFTFPPVITDGYLDPANFTPSAPHSAFSPERHFKELTYSADASLVLTREAYGPARLWTATTNPSQQLVEPRVIAPPAGTITPDASITSDGAWLLTGTIDGKFRFWSTEPGLSAPKSPEWPVGIYRSRVSLALEPGGHHLLTYTDQGQARLWSLGLPNPPTLLKEVSVVDGVISSSDKRWAVLLEKGGSLSLWDLEKAGKPSPLPSPLAWDENHRPIAIAPGEAWLLTGDRANGMLHLWDLRSGSTKPIDLRSHSEFSRATFSPDARWLVTGGSDGLARLWDLPRVRAMASRGLSPDPVGKYQHESPVRSIAFSPDGRRLATSDAHETVVLWSLQAPFRTEVLPQQRETADDLAFSADGHWFATGGRELRLWRLPASGPISDPSVLLDELDQAVAVRHLVFDPQSRWLFSLGQGGAFRRWSLNPAVVRDVACRWAGRNLTRQEWQQYLGDEPYRRTCPDFPEPTAK